MPDLRPFYGGTYFPPGDMQGRPGFVSILKGIEDAYKNRPADVEKTAEQLVNILRQYAEPATPQSPILIDDAFVEGLLRRSVSDYDPTNGGFGGAPKFPRETVLELLLVYMQSRSPAAAFKSQVSQMLQHALDAMADGGIRDHLGGGFHRYSTDAEWLVPHFEIMLYDNAMLAWCYAEAFAQTKEKRYADMARGVFDFIGREMTSSAGAFYTAIDAEVDSQEGLNYLWTDDEIESILGKDDSQLFNKLYGVDRGPNFADPHHGSGVADKNILFLPVPLNEAAKNLKIDPATLESRLAPMRQKLYEARQKRKQPLLDTKIITSWNALMIRALAHGGKVLEEPRYTAAAEKAAEFLLQSHRTPTGGLFRTSREGLAKYHGFLDDYAFLIQALLALADTTGKPTWKERAGELAALMSAKFTDAEHGGFYFTEAEATDLIVRQKTASDSPLPSGNAIAAMVMLELGHLIEARRTLAVFAQPMDSHGEGMSAMVQVALLCVRKAGAFTVSAGAGQPDERPLSPEQVAQDVVTTRTQWRTPADLLVYVSILRGFHINAHEVAADAPLIATTLAIEDASASVQYPDPEELRVGFSDQPLRGYSGDLTILVSFSTPPKPGLNLELSLTYQACDESACLPPVMKTIRVATDDR